MRILQVCSANNLGGGERHVIGLTKSLIKRGHEVQLVVRRASPLRAALDSQPVQWHEFGLRNALDLISARQIAGVIRSEKIDVLHTHLGRDYIFCGMAARMTRPIRFFITRHHYNPIKSNPFSGWVFSEARALIAVSESVREQLVTAFPSLINRMVVIPNWIDTRIKWYPSREEARKKLGITRRMAVAMIGQITPLKRQDVFIRAAAHLIKERNITDVDFLIIGAPGEKDRAYMEELHRMVNQAGIGANFRFTGYIEELPPHLVALDVVAVVSENEAFSLTLVEAMAAGCAVIATRVGGMAEIVEHGVTGLFVERDDLRALIDTLSKFLADQSLRERVGNAARENVIKRFDRESVIDRIERLYIDGCANVD
ncbi:MAG: glycosyltransferase family 4 protein [Acidobacteria bacterium]|nr:glycosyltransferase family 4 protein [Acidobacteriota bacterium]